MPSKMILMISGVSKRADLKTAFEKFGSVKSRAKDPNSKSSK